MDISTALEAAHAPLTLEEIKEYCGVMFSKERLDTLIRCGDVKQVPGLDDVYWSVPASMKKRNTVKKCQSPMKANERQTIIRNIVDFRTKLNTITKELDALNLKKDTFPTQEQKIAHMNRLHVYNDTKDIGMTIMGYLSELEKTQTSELYERYGLDNQD